MFITILISKILKVTPEAVAWLDNNLGVEL
jgi:hypothetical protein